MAIPPSYISLEMIKVLIADDHKLVRDSLKQILDAEPDIKCIGEARDGTESIDLAERLNPDVILVDVNMPTLNGIQVTQKIKADFPDMSVLILTAYDNEEYLVSCLEAGADGFVLKAKMACDQLVNAIRMVHGGPGVFDHDAVASLRKMIKKTPSVTTDELPKLCDREREILSHASRGMTTKQIANVLGISNYTVNTHFTNIFKKLNAQSRVEAVVAAIEYGLISTRDPQ